MVISIGIAEHFPGAQGPPVGRRSRGGLGPFFRGRFRWRWGPGCEAVQGAEKRLADLGIVIGSRVKVVRKAPFGGPIEVEIAGSRFLIGRRLAKRIIVEV